MTDQNTKLPPPTLTNPYFSIEKEDALCRKGVGGRVNSIVPASTLDFLLSIQPRPPGVIKYTVNIIYDKLIRELKRRGITSFSHQAEFLVFMRDCEIGLPGEVLVKRECPSPAAARPIERPLPNSPVVGPVPQATEPPNGRGTEGDHHSTPGTAGQPSPVQQPSTPKQGGRSRKGVAESRSV